MDIVLFKISDLRIRDHEPLYTANKTNNNIIHIFIWDYKWDDKTSNDILIMGKYKKQFLKESLQNLSDNLNKINIHLNIYYGNPDIIITDLIDKYKIQNIYTYQDINIPINATAKIHYFWNNTMYHISDLPFTIDNIPNSFTDFKKQIKIRARKEFFTQTNNKSIKLDGSIKINDIDIDIPQTELLIKGGEDNGWEYLKILLRSNNISNYKQDRNNFISTCDLSPWLDFGCLSAKSIFYQLKMYEKNKHKNNSTYLFWSDLLLRDYYKFKSIKLKNNLFEKNGISNKTYNYSNNKVSFDKWINGQTGIPLIDAFMIQIKNTGFISNKGRLIISSFLVNDLNLEWTLGAEYFNKMLINSEITYNYSLWHYIAGIGNISDNSIYFNPIKQCQLYDKNCNFIKEWIPELKEKTNDELINPKEGISNYYDLLVKINFINKKSL